MVDRNHCDRALKRGRFLYQSPHRATIAEIAATEKINEAYVGRTGDC
jgi:hypothetical protein